MKILLIGLGSVGQRHARNLRDLLGSRVELIAWRTRKLPLPQDLSGLVRTVPDLDAALSERPDAGFITNPSSLHLSAAQAAADAGCALFIEKPLADRWDGVEHLMNTADRRGLIVMLGYQWRFHPGLLRVRGLLRAGAVGRAIAARLDFGEYLPGWHPHEDYRDSYAAKLALGGGVLLSQIHEFDYLYWLWGLPERLYSTGGRLTGLEIDVEDFVVTQLEYAPGKAIRLVTVHLDYVRRPGVRTCEVIGEDGRITLNLLDGRLACIGPDGRESVEVHAFERNDLFRDEIRHFLACLSGTETPIPSLRDGAMSLKLALAARQSLAMRVPVSLAADLVTAE